MFEPGFVRQSAAKSALTSTQPPVNPTFHLTARPEIKGLTPEQQKRLTTVAILGVSQVRFPTGSSNLSEDARRDLEEQVIPVLRNTVGTYLRIEGSAGWATGKGLERVQGQCPGFRACPLGAGLSDQVRHLGRPTRARHGRAVLPCECADADAQRDDRAGVSLATT